MVIFFFVITFYVHYTGIS